MDYDLSDGHLDRNLTLFEEEISVPVGSIGPITLGSLFLDSPIGRILGSFLQEDTWDGSYILEAESTLYAANIYQLEQMAGDVSEPFTWTPGSVSGSVEGIASMLGFLGLTCLGQEIQIIGGNPLMDEIPVRATVSVVCVDSDFETSYSAAEEISESLITGSGSYNSLYRVELPGEVMDVVSSVTLDDLSLDLPAYPAGQLDEPLETDVLDIKMKHRCRIGFSEHFNLSQTLPLENIGLAIGKYNLHRCEASVELANSLPLSVTVHSIKVLKPGEDGWEVDDNLSVSSEVVIAGGSALEPGVTQLNLQIAAAEGTIPDIDALEIELEVSVEPGCEGVALSSRQGISVKSAFARVRGGITIPEN